MNKSPAAERVRVALVGMGRMGRAIDRLADENNFEVVARLSRTDTTNGISKQQLNNAHVAIEFTLPESALSNIDAILAAGVPVVTGTTGWNRGDGALQRMVASHNTAALWAPNFSMGVQLFLRMAEHAGRQLRIARGFDVHVVETHHAAKKDAPSGTGAAVAEQLASGLGHPVPITSVRVGSVPGTHQIVMDAEYEQITLTHEARNRDVFAAGALATARWLSTQSAPRLYTMNDMVDSLLASYTTSEPQYSEGSA